MNAVELRDLDDARSYILHSLLLQRAAPLSGESVKASLTWAQEIAAEGDPLPPVGFIADLGQAVFFPDRAARTPRAELNIPGLPPGLPRLYEDHVLGKFYADWSFDRAADALRGYQGRDQARGLAFVVRQFREQAGLGGVLLAPALFRGLLELSPDEVIRRAWDGASANGILPLVVEQYQELVAGSRRCAEVLSSKDLFELEKRTALAELGQRVALRQVLDIAERLERRLPQRKVKPLAGRQEVPTRVLDEDTYPVGGFSSISTKGSIESLLHSQLAFMEVDDRPDLFDVKFVRDELYYYSRDENQFLRRRRSFVFVLHPELAHARFKDPELPVQRLILALGLIVCVVRKLTDWLGEDALRFELAFVAAGDGSQPLAQEQELLRLILGDDLANGGVALTEVSNVAAATARCAELARRSLCHALVLGTSDRDLHADDVLTARLIVDRAEPSFGRDEQEPMRSEADEPLAAWAEILVTLLRCWV